MSEVQGALIYVGSVFVAGLIAGAILVESVIWFWKKLSRRWGK